MEDAYVIGIRLALENGVSAGIAEIAKDLAALDTVVLKTTADLRTLADLGAGISRPTPLPLRATDETTPPLATEPALAFEPSRPPAGPRPSAPLAKAETTSFADPAPTPAPLILQPSTTYAPTHSSTVPIQPADRSPFALPESSTASPAPVARPPLEHRSQAPANRPDPPRGFAAFAPPPPPLDPPTTAATTPKSTSPPADLVRPAAPVAPPPPPVFGKPEARAAMHRSETDSGRASETPRAGPFGGDVYLDGARMGRWLADHLARETTRPQTGSAAFDPRISPSWPGTLQGN